MRNLLTSYLPIILFIKAFLLTTTLPGQFQIINNSLEGIYLCEPLEPFVEKYRSRSTLENVVLSTDRRVFYPFRTLTDINNASFECALIYTNNWLGDSIIHETNSGDYIFHFTPVRKNGVDNGYKLSTQDSFRIPAGLETGDQFMINVSIEATVISESIDSWNGIQLQKQTIQLINNGNPEYNWDSGEIVITKEHGIYNFPNLQYFPFEWKNVTLSGITQGKLGLQDISEVDTYRMSPGDEYTAQYRHSFFGPDVLGTNFYDRIKCLSIIDEDNLFQLRSIQRERLHIISPSGSWTYTIDTIEENIIYGQQQILGRANETINNEFPYTSLVVVKENGYKFSNSYNPSFLNPHCYSEQIDACYNHFTFKGGFTNYFDCSGIFNFENFYLPVHRIVDGEEYGDDLVFDSIKTLKKKSLTINNVLIYPNPVTDNFSIQTNSNDVMKYFFMTDIYGKQFKIIPENKNVNIYNFEVLIPAGMYFISGSDLNGHIYDLGKIMIIR